MGYPELVPSDMEMMLQVIGAGASRTGTLSLARALETLLNGPVMHGGVQMLCREDSYVKLVRDFMQQRHDKPAMKKLLRELTAGFVGTTDCPCNSFVPELLELYPGAKVVLVTRDPQRWVESIAPVFKHWNPWWFRYLVWPYPGWRWLPDLMEEIGKLPSMASDRPLSTDILAEHNQWVKSNVPPEKLLVMELGEGWEPLCRFLDMPVPDVPFPHVNDKKALKSAAWKVMTDCMKLWAVILLVFGSCVWGVYRGSLAYL